MKKDENPKVLLEKMTAVLFKYQGNAQANITEDDLVAQAVQALYLPFITQQWWGYTKQSSDWEVQPR
jgi:hypothetical protein